MNGNFWFENLRGGQEGPVSLDERQLMTIIKIAMEKADNPTRERFDELNGKRFWLTLTVVE